jgi:glycosyltransferase involved in cell wall biosynthesis
MRVLQLAKFYPPECGGIESVVRDLTEGLNRAGWPTDVLCAHRHMRSLEQRAPEGFRIMRAGSLGMLQSTSVSPALIGFARRMVADYDIIHVHMPNPLAALALWCTRPRACIVVHWHSDVISQRLALKLYEPLQSWLLARADAVIATSIPYAQSSRPLQRWKDKLAVVPLGIGDNRLRTDSARVAVLREAWRGRRIIFALGRMSRYKGFDVLIEAASRLPDDSVVLIGGSGPCLQRHRADVARRGLGGKVHFLGRIPDDELATYHQAADVFCMPSLTRAEAFGVAQLEAMSAGRPVVCSAIDGSGLSWVNQHEVTGLTVPPGSPIELGAALCRLLAEPALAARLGASARQRVLSHFSVANMVDQAMALYQRVATHRN